MLKILKNKIDFVIIIVVDNANPNGNPSDENNPRTTLDGYGEISAECIKRKIRNRLQDMLEQVFIQSVEHRGYDGATSLRERYDRLLKSGNNEDAKALLLDKFIDIRAFGAVVALKDKKGKNSESDDETENSVTIGIRGPVTIRQTLSVEPIEIVEQGITKSVNNEPSENGKKDASTMGKRLFVRHGVYLIKGSINPYMAENTHLTVEDVEKIKTAVETLFVNDSSAARPEGSMNTLATVWFEHEGSELGYVPTHFLQDSVIVEKKEGIDTPTSYQDYNYMLDETLLKENPNITCSESGFVKLERISR